MRVLIVTSVQAEADAVGSIDHSKVIVGGVGRTNAAAATTEAIIRDGALDMVVNAGVAGALPGGGLSIGDVVVASRCVYAEEGMLVPSGFTDIAASGLALGDFSGNAVPVDERALTRLSLLFRCGPIATVATCSGTDAAAEEVVRRTGAIAEAMEGAAVVHAARRLGMPAVELRSVSNSTGDRDRQAWNLPKGLMALGEAVLMAG